MLAALGLLHKNLTKGSCQLTESLLHKNLTKGSCQLTESWQLHLYCGQSKLRVSDQNGISWLYIIVEICHSGRKPLKCSCQHWFYWQLSLVGSHAICPSVPSGRYHSYHKLRMLLYEYQHVESVLIARQILRLLEVWQATNLNFNKNINYQHIPKLYMLRFAFPIGCLLLEC